MKFIPLSLISLCLGLTACAQPQDSQSSDVGGMQALQTAFETPPESARPGVYWYFMDGNQNREEMIADLESMVEVGIGGVIFLEVNIGVPAGPVSFMSEEWQSNLVHAFKKAKDLGLEVILGTGPGWAGSGGSWVRAEDSMQHLVGSVTEVKGPQLFNESLPVPDPHRPSRHSGMNDSHKAEREEWFQDVTVLAFPTLPGGVAGFDQRVIKTLQDVRPYTIDKSAPTHIDFLESYPVADASQIIDPNRVIDLSSKIAADGTLRWDVPAGEWTIMRFVARSTGQTTRPAPRAGHGFETDKMSAEAYRRHWDNYQAKIIEKLGPLVPEKGLTTIHLDSWEMGSQNWSADFREEFEQRRGYDPQPYYPAYMGMVVGSREKTERFLWDLRKTVQEVILDEYASEILALAREHGLLYSNEPYDMNPAGNMDLGSIADIIMCEFWTPKGGNDAQYSCFEAVSVAHTMGRSRVNAEAFTSKAPFEYTPKSMKNQTDWAFALGINGIYIHTFQHQATGDQEKPGMSMGRYGVHWNRNQTWWPMVEEYHEYLTRCSSVLRQGVAVRDILYMTPEGAPMIFSAPQDALSGVAEMRDMRGYAFDGVTPRILIERAEVRNGRIAFPGGTEYALLVLPEMPRMTPELLAKLTELVEAGATIIGNPPVKSPSLVGYPEVDQQIAQQAEKLWGVPELGVYNFGQGRVFHRTTKTIQAMTPAGAGNWIWSNDLTKKKGSAELRYEMVLDPASLKRAVIKATADDTFELSINGQPLLKGDSWRETYEADLLPHVKKGVNVIEVRVLNLAPQYGGFLAGIDLITTDGTQRILGTDQTWQARSGGQPWAEARVQGAGTMSPWKLSGQGVDGSLYPKYETLVGILESMGIEEDFEADAAIRFGHRRAGEADIYFVANTEDTAVVTNCRFRVEPVSAEVWNPVSGEVRPISFKPLQDGRVELSMDFWPQQSFFVVFDSSATGAPTKRIQAASAFPELQSVRELSADWELSFDPEWGPFERLDGRAAGHFKLDTLMDWSKHEHEGIRYYSGTALYQKSFNLSSSELAAGKGRRYLDLGDVSEICRVRLNGEDLGILWTAPWRLEITDLLRVGENELEIEVINSWVNRMVGDEQPGVAGTRTLKFEDGLLGGREFKTGPYTFTHNRFVRGNTGLKPSGLLGPVSILKPLEP